MDYVEHFRREVAAFEAAGHAAASLDSAPEVASCPGWVVTDLVLHLGAVHRFVARILRERMQQPPDMAGDRAWLGLPGECVSWLPPGRAPRRSPVPAALLGWFHDGAADLLRLFEETVPDERVWTWSADHSAGFWQRMQTIEAAVHRWDAEDAVGVADPIDAALATDAVGQTFDIMAPMRRAVAQAPPGRGERFLFRRTDGPRSWAVRFDGDVIRRDAGDGEYDVQISGSASGLALFLWRRGGADGLDVRGDRSLLDRYFALVPPL